MDEPTMSETVVLTSRQGAGKRGILAVIGLVALILPVADLWHGLFALSPVALFFWIIVLGAAFVGAILIGGAIVGDSTELRISPGQITLVRANLLRRSEEDLERGDIRSVRVRVEDWESGPDTYSVEILLRQGRPVGSNDFPRREDAEALAERARRALRLTEGNLLE